MAPFPPVTVPDVSTTFSIFPPEIVPAKPPACPLSEPVTFTFAKVKFLTEPPEILSNIPEPFTVILDNVFPLPSMCPEKLSIGVIAV